MTNAKSWPDQMALKYLNEEETDHFMRISYTLMQESNYPNKGVTKWAQGLVCQMRLKVTSDGWIIGTD